MTPEEIGEEIARQNIQALSLKGVTPNKTILDLLNDAGLRGFKLGSEFIASATQGALLLKMVSMDKDKESGK